MLEMARVLWLSPLGGGAMARHLWRWRDAAGQEGRRLLVDEARRLRGERDQAMERERTLKRGLGALRDERKALELQLRAAHEKAPKAVVDGAELAQARKVAAQAAAERDAHARQARDLQAALDVEREKERGLQAQYSTALVQP